MTFKTFNDDYTPVPGTTVRSAVNRIADTWAESRGGLDGEHADMIRHDLFELIGMVRGLLLMLEVRRPPKQEENAPEGA